MSMIGFRLPARAALAVALASLMLPVAAKADPAAFYRGKTVTILIGFGAGGGYDTYARVLARNYGRFIPGNPTVIPRNMPGAGALLVANHIFNAAPKDGTEIGLVAASTIMEPLLGNEKARYAGKEFTWIGSMTKEINFCGLGKAAGVKTFDQWRKSGKTLTFGATGPAAITYQYPLIINNILGAKAKPLPGYKGTKEVSLAIQRGEVDGMCGLFISSIQSQYQGLVDSGELTLVVQMGPQKTDMFGPVPSVYDFIKSDVDKQVFDVHFGQLLLARPFIAPPGVPADRAKALQTAFMATLGDAKFLEDAKKTRVSINPVTAEEAMALLDKFADFPKEAFDAAKKAIGR